MSASPVRLDSSNDGGRYSLSPAVGERAGVRGTTRASSTAIQSPAIIFGAWVFLGRPLFVFLFAFTAAAAEFPPEGIEFFEKRVRPVLVERCYKCHSATSEKLKGELRLD